MWVPTLGPLFLSLVCGICIGFASDACRICVDFVGFAFLGVSKTYGNIKKAIGFIPPHLRFYNIITLQKLVSAVCTFCLSPLILEKVLP